jgi:hypothetical protein
MGHIFELCVAAALVVLILAVAYLVAGSNGPAGLAGLAAVVTAASGLVIVLRERRGD